MTDPSAAPRDDTFVIQDVATLKVLADPVRMRMLLATAEHARTVKEMASTLGVPATRLYYHVKLLERHELIHVASRRMVSGIEERSYLANAKSWNVAPELMSSVAGTGVVKSMFDIAAAELDMALADDRYPPGDPKSSVAALTFTTFYPDRRAGRTVRSWLVDAMIDFAARPVRTRPEYHAAFAIYKGSGA